MVFAPGVDGEGTATAFEGRAVRGIMVAARRAQKT